MVSRTAQYPTAARHPARHPTPRGIQHGIVFHAARHPVQQRVVAKGQAVALRGCCCWEHAAKLTAADIAFEARLEGAGRVRAAASRRPSRRRPDAQYHACPAVRCEMARRVATQCGHCCADIMPCVWDTVPCGIPCRAGYCAVRDTVPCAILCPLRVPLCVCVGWRADALDSVRVVPLGWAPCQGRSPHARTGFRSIRRKWAPLSAAVAWKHRLSGANSVAGEQRILSSYAFRRGRDMADPKATRAQLDRLRGGPGLGR